jgi:hypothetical protein
MPYQWREQLNYTLIHHQEAPQPFPLPIPYTTILVAWQIPSRLGCDEHLRSYAPSVVG